MVHSNLVFIPVRIDLIYIPVDVAITHVASHNRDGTEHTSSQSEHTWNDQINCSGPRATGWSLMNLDLESPSIDCYVVSCINGDLIHFLFEGYLTMWCKVVDSITGISVWNLSEIVVSILPFKVWMRYETDIFSIDTWHISVYWNLPFNFFVFRTCTGYSFCPIYYVRNIDLPFTKVTRRNVVILSLSTSSEVHEKLIKGFIMLDFLTQILKIWALLVAVIP